MVSNPQEEVESWGFPPNHTALRWEWVLWQECVSAFPTCFNVDIFSFTLLKDQLKYIQNFKSLFEQTLIQVSTKWEVVRNAPLIGASCKTFYSENSEAKQGN